MGPAQARFSPVQPNGRLAEAASKTLFYWRNVGVQGVARVLLLNTDRSEFVGETGGIPKELFEERLGDARDLSGFADGSIDLVHSNSVIEHVGGWPDIVAMAREARRVGRSGWIQTPAQEFPIEPHFHLPLVHWLGPTVLSSALRFSPLPSYRKCSASERRAVVERASGC